MSELIDKRYPDGSIIKSSDDWEASNFSDYHIHYPILGVVLEVFPVDHFTNKSAIGDARLRGFHWIATVAIVNDGGESKTAPLTNVVIAPTGPSGVDNFTQDLPTPTTGMLDGSEYTGKLVGVNLDLLNGDRCLVQFLGGKYNQPIMTSWMPHPANRRDSSTGGYAPDSIDQGRPHLQRRSGTTFAVTPEGSIFIDTNGAASEVEGAPGGYVRTERDLGGDLNIDMKSSASFAVDFNPPVKVATQEPSLLQPNPPPADNGTGERSTESTSLYMDADTILASAAYLIKLATVESDIIISPATNLYIGNEGSGENMVLGQEWKTTMTTLMTALISFMEDFKSHKHATGTGPSSEPLVPELTNVQLLIDEEVQPLIENIDDNLSDYIFGSKEPPESAAYLLTAKEEGYGEDE